MKIYVEKDIDIYLTKYIDIFSILYVEPKNHLKNREKEFFIANIKLLMNKKPLLGKEANQELKKGRFQIRVYRQKLKKKEWIIQTPYGIMLPPAFDFSKKFPKTLTFNFKLELNDDLNTEKNTAV